MSSKGFVLLFALAIVLALSNSAGADLYSFKVIAPLDNPVDALIGESQMSLEITDAGNGNVFFTYRNIGSEASSITDIYVDDGSLLALVAIHNTPGSVEFTAYPTPPNLPRGQNLAPPFVADLCFSADSDSPVQPLGINPQETLIIEYSLTNGRTLTNVTEELATGELRIGIHVQGYDSEGSEAFILIMPEPASLLLVTLGAWGLLRRRR